MSMTLTDAASNAALGETEVATKWEWWSGYDGEHYNGPFGSRAQAIAELDGDDGYIVEARQDPVMLSYFVDAESLIDAANEGAVDCRMTNEDGDPIFDPSVDDLADLQARLKSACDEWQAVRGLVFVPWAFTEMRNKERVAAEGGDA